MQLLDLRPCHAVQFSLLLGDVKLANTYFHQVCLYIFNIPNICHKFTFVKSRIALQVARKIAQCDRVFTFKKASATKRVHGRLFRNARTFEIEIKLVTVKCFTYANH